MLEILANISPWLLMSWFSGEGNLGIFLEPLMINA